MDRAEPNFGLLAVICLRLQQGWETHVRRNWQWFAVAALAAAVDGLTTIHFMIHEGIDREFHPLIWAISHMFGPILGPIVGKGYQLGALLVVTKVYPWSTRLLCGLVTGLYTAAGIHNALMCP